MSTLKIKRENGKIFCPLADSWHIETPEEKVRQEYIKILVEDYGYSLDQMAQEIKVNNSQRGQGKARADIVIWKSKQDKIESKAAFIVVECKAENVRIREEDYYQGYNYASWAGASFFVTTNEKETKYFNVDKDYLPKELVEVVAIPTAEEALNDKKAKDIKIIDIRSISVLADYFLIAHGNSDSQVNALVENVEEQLHKAGYPLKEREGQASGKWVLMDFGDVIIHVFDRENRLFYNLERIWKDGKEIPAEEL